MLPTQSYTSLPTPHAISKKYSRATTTNTTTQPPPPPSAPLPPVPTPRRGRSNTFTATISTWAARVTPGSPLPPTPKSPENKFGLTTLGYTEVFELNFTLSPSPSPSPSPTTAAPKTPTHNKPTLARRIRSFSVLRSRTTTTETSIPPVPPMPPTMSTKDKKQPPAQKKYPTIKPKPYHPPPLINDLMLIQFTDGGSLEDVSRKHMQRRAARTTNDLTVGYNHNNGGGVGTVYQDGKGGIWADCDEEMEYRALLDSPSSHCEWVGFRSSSPDKENGEGRRGSDSSASNGACSEEGMVPLGVRDAELPCLPPLPALLLLPPSSIPNTIPGRRRKRPAPLHFTSSSSPHTRTPPASAPASRSAYVPGAVGGVDVENARREFLDGSFAPTPLCPLAQPGNTHTSSPSRRPSIPFASTSVHARHEHDGQEPEPEPQPEQEQEQGQERGRGPTTGKMASVKRKLKEKRSTLFWGVKRAE